MGGDVPSPALIYVAGSQGYKSGGIKVGHKWQFLATSSKLLKIRYYPLSIFSFIIWKSQVASWKKRGTIGPHSPSDHATERSAVHVTLVSNERRKVKATVSEVIVMEARMRKLP